LTSDAATEGFFVAEAPITEVLVVGLVKDLPAAEVGTAVPPPVVFSAVDSCYLNFY